MTTTKQLTKALETTGTATIDIGDAVLEIRYTAPVYVITHVDLYGNRHGLSASSHRDVAVKIAMKIAR